MRPRADVRTVAEVTRNALDEDTESAATTATTAAAKKEAEDQADTTGRADDAANGTFAMDEDVQVCAVAACVSLRPQLPSAQCAWGSRLQPPEETSRFHSDGIPQNSATDRARRVPYQSMRAARMM